MIKLLLFVDDKFTMTPANPERVATASPSIAQIKDIVKPALRTPSGDNCQPWVFLWDGKTLSIRHVEERGRHFLNIENHASILTLGCLLESLRISALNVGWQTQWKVNFRNENWAKVWFSPTKDAIDIPVSALESRYTDRRRFQRTPVSDLLLKKIKNDEKSFLGCHVKWLSSFPSDLLEFLGRAEFVAFDHPKAHADLYQWLRFGKKEAMQSCDGMPWQSLGIDYVSSRILKWASTWPRQKRINQLGFRKFLYKNQMNNIRSGSGLALFSVNSTSKEALVNVGGLAFRTWVRLNQAGLGVQPVTTGSFLPFESMVGSDLSGLLPAYQELFRESSALLKRCFELSKDEYPVWMFRFGKAQTCPKNSKSYRLNLDSVLKFT